VEEDTILADASLPELIGNQLERILVSRRLASSPSLSRLLRFVVEETLAGRGTAITEYNLGVAVFHRGDEFNPRTDPIVRVQTHHLRARLRQYYAEAGGDVIAIELPPRSYVPVFHLPVLEAQPVASLSAPPLAAQPQPAARRSARVPVAVAVAVALAAAAMALVGHPWWKEARNGRHEPDPAAHDLYLPRPLTVGPQN
jgi:hypothetical protein